MDKTEIPRQCPLSEVPLNAEFTEIHVSPQFASQYLLNHDPKYAANAVEITCLQESTETCRLIL
jgi:hypothetical protein